MSMVVSLTTTPPYTYFSLSLSLSVGDREKSQASAPPHRARFLEKDENLKQKQLTTVRNTNTAPEIRSQVHYSYDTSLL
jgi:hypothetical protein